MKHDFIDKYSHLDSYIHNIDPRIKIISTVAMILLIISEPRMRISSFPLYYFLILFLILTSRIPLKYFLGRCLIVAPFILLAVGSLPLSYVIAGDNILPGGADMKNSLPLFMASIFLKSIAAIILLVLLTSTTRFRDLLWGLKKLRMPRAFNLIAGLVYRYIFILTDELHKTTRARESRTPGTIKMSRFRVYGNQAAVVLLRGWDRAERVYAAMVSRGFTGDFPDIDEKKIGSIQVMSSLLVIVIFLLIRILNPLGKI